MGRESGASAQRGGASKGGSNTPTPANSVPKKPKPTQSKGSAGNAAKSKPRNDFAEEKILQAVLLADSFAVKFRPITWERPKATLLVCFSSSFVCWDS
jgi:hypothetical protein